MSEHHITPLRTYLIIAASLLFLSGVTVWVSYIDLGSFNIVLAMFVATVKASLVAFFFMHLLWDDKKNLTIIDYGLGNNLSLFNALERLDYEVKISSAINKIRDSDLVFLPGVGSYSQGIRNLKKRGIFDVLIENSKLGKPIIGICLGMQMMLDKGYEDGIN